MFGVWVLGVWGLGSREGVRTGGGGCADGFKILCVLGLGFHTRFSYFVFRVPGLGFQVWGFVFGVSGRPGEEVVQPCVTAGFEFEREDDVHGFGVFRFRV